MCMLRETANRHFHASKSDHLFGGDVPCCRLERGARVTAGPPSNPWKDLQEDTDLENINSRACESVYASDDEDTAPN